MPGLEEGTTPSRDMRWPRAAQAKALVRISTSVKPATHSVGKGVGIDGVVDVVVVEGGELVAGNAVGGHELASGAQYPSHLGEQAILQFSRWHVMEHGQRHRAGEVTVIERHLTGVGVHDLDVGSCEARC